jgi:hypothetical protein
MSYRPQSEKDYLRKTALGRLKMIVTGALLLFAIGLILSLVFTSVRYGGNLLDRVFSGDSKNAAAGKLAYDKRTNTYLGVIKAEGYSTRRGTEVYYIERAGGGMIEVAKANVLVREPG